MSQFHEIPADLLEQINLSDRAPLTVPDGANVQGDRSRWTEVMTVETTEYEEKSNDDGNAISNVRVRFRVSDTFSPDPTNAGKRFNWNRQINWTMLKERTDSGKVMASEIGLRTMFQLILAAGLASDKSEIKSLGQFFASADGVSPMSGKTVNAVIRQAPNRDGEVQQEPQRFAPYA